MRGLQTWLLSPADHLGGGGGGASCILGSTGSVWEWADCTPSGPFLCQLPEGGSGLICISEPKMVDWGGFAGWGRGLWEM